LKLIEKVEPLHGIGEQRVLIIDDTVKPKCGKKIEVSCKYIWSNKEKHTVGGLNIVSLSYADSHSIFQLDFALRMNESRHKALEEYSQKLHHRSNAYQRRQEELKDKNVLALEMVERAMDAGVVADYLLVDSWYAKPEFILKAKEIGIDTVTRLPNNRNYGTSKASIKVCRHSMTIIIKFGVCKTVTMERSVTVIST